MISKVRGNASHIQGVSLPNQRVRLEGIHADAFIPHEACVQVSPLHMQHEDFKRIHGFKVSNKTFLSTVVIEDADSGAPMGDFVAYNPEFVHPFREASRFFSRIGREPERRSAFYET